MSKDPVGLQNPGSGLTCWLLGGIMRTSGRLDRVGAEYCVTSCDLGVFVEEAAESVSSNALMSVSAGSAAPARTPRPPSRCPRGPAIGGRRSQNLPILHSCSSTAI